MSGLILILPCDPNKRFLTFLAEPVLLNEFHKLAECLLFFGLFGSMRNPRSHTDCSESETPTIMAILSKEINGSDPMFVAPGEGLLADISLGIL